MKTSVSEIQFDLTGAFSGDYPLTYSIRVDNPEGEHDGDLKSRHLISLLERYGNHPKNFPKVLMAEIYDDCCLAYLTRVATMRRDEKTVFTVEDGYIDGATLEKILQMIRMRSYANVDLFFDDVEDCTKCDNYAKCTCELKELFKSSAEIYADEGDWILELSEPEELVKITLILLRLRKDIWRAARKTGKNLARTNFSIPAEKCPA